jgi:hypothetical protein
MRMRKHILAQSAYQLFWLFFFMYGLPVMFPSRYGFTDRCEFYDRDAGAMCAKAAVDRWALLLPSRRCPPPALPLRRACPLPGLQQGHERARPPSPPPPRRFGWASADAAYLCNVKTHCGFPCNRDSRETFKCPLSAKWGPAAVPGEVQQALCNTPANASASGSCKLYDDFRALEDLLGDK